MHQTLGYMFFEFIINRTFINDVLQIWIFLRKNCNFIFLPPPNLYMTSFMNVLVWVLVQLPWSSEVDCLLLSSSSLSSSFDLDLCLELWFSQWDPLIKDWSLWSPSWLTECTDMAWDSMWDWWSNFSWHKGQDTGSMSSLDELVLSQSSENAKIRLFRCEAKYISVLRFTQLYFQDFLFKHSYSFE